MVLLSFNSFTPHNSWEHITTTNDSLFSWLAAVEPPTTLERRQVREWGECIIIIFIFI